MTRDSRSIRITTPGRLRDAFCCDLAEGLHAVAQPLTIVQNELSPWRIENLSESDLRESVSNSAREIERVCSLFGIVRQLIAIERFAPELENLISADLIAEAVGGVDRLYEERRIGLRVGSEGPYMMMAHRKRALQSLTILLLTACALSDVGQSVEINSQATSRYVSIGMKNPDVELKYLDAHHKLAMTLVESSIRGQQGKFGYELQPFGARLRFKKASASAGAQRI